MPRPLDQRLQAIRLLCLDVDGVLTEGQIFLGPDGQESKAFNCRDGIGLKCWRLAGHEAAIITARGSPAVERRAQEMGIREVVLNSNDKRSALEELCRRRELDLAEVAFMGDDLQDLQALMAAGVSISVAQCPLEIAERVDHVTERPGGKGAVREAIEWILKGQSRWDGVLENFLP